MTQVVQNQKIKLMWIIFPLIFLFACTNNDVFIKYQSIPLKGWNKDSICSFNIPVNDVSISYNMYINVRNRGEYPHQNLWLFIRQIAPDSVITNDTINFYLADQRGKWLGSGVGSVFEMPIIYMQNFHFKQLGTYHFEISQGMRDSVLPGINEIGMRMEKISSK